VHPSPSKVKTRQNGIGHSSDESTDSSDDSN
jgi:hypothetical protein